MRCLESEAPLRIELRARIARSRADWLRVDNLLEVFAELLLRAALLPRLVLLI
jgi:hypothetical protein